MVHFCFGQKHLKGLKGLLLFSGFTFIFQSTLQAQQPDYSIYPQPVSVQSQGVVPQQQASLHSYGSCTNQSVGTAFSQSPEQKGSMPAPLTSGCTPQSGCGPKDSCTTTGSRSLESCTCDSSSCTSGCTSTACDNGERSLFSALSGGNSSWLKDNNITIGGWLQYGYYSNSNPLGFNLNFNDNRTQFGSRQKHGLHQAWIYMEKALADDKDFDWGFRVDGMYGLDADDTQAFGSSDAWDAWDADTPFASHQGIYGFAIPQAYVEFGNSDLSVKVGHFFTLVGYEVVTAPDNFFFSHAYTMFNNEPFTHTGALVTYRMSDNVEIYGGWTAGWDTGFDRYDNGSNFLGGSKVSLSDDVSFTYITTAGDFGWRGKGYVHSVVAEMQLTEKLAYIFQSDFGDIQHDGNAFFGPGGDEQLSINNYLIYTINEKLGVGGRFEWWKTGGGAFSGIGSFSIYEATLGANIKPLDNVIIRPEIRKDWSDNLFDYTTFAVDAIVTF